MDGTDTVLKERIMKHTIICKGISSTYRENVFGTLCEAIARCNTVMGWGYFTNASVIDEGGSKVYVSSRSASVQTPVYSDEEVCVSGAVV